MNHVLKGNGNSKKTTPANNRAVAGCKLFYSFLTFLFPLLCLHHSFFSQSLRYTLFWPQILLLDLFILLMSCGPANCSCFHKIASRRPKIVDDLMPTKISLRISIFPKIELIIISENVLNFMNSMSLEKFKFHFILTSHLIIFMHDECQMGNLFLT